MPINDVQSTQLLTALDLVIMRQVKGGDFVLASAAPSWFERFRASVFPEGPEFHPERMSEILVDFMSEFVGVWEGGPGTPPKQTSTWWTQRDRDGQMHYLRATAARLKETNFMILERASANSELFAAIQKYKEGMFEFDRLLNAPKQTKEKSTQMKEPSLVEPQDGFRSKDNFLMEAPSFLNNAQTRKRPVFVFAIRPENLTSIKAKFGSNEESVVVSACSDILGRTFRKTDLRARFPENLFVVAAIETHYDFRKKLLERLIKNTEKYNSESNNSYPLSLEVAVARQGTSESLNMEELVKAAENKFNEKKAARAFSALPGPNGTMTPLSRPQISKPSI